ncbi:hypothetical protein L2E82_02739 [Cichorium intybus]|uniref:Uncharacterized protein n=1 Tax=Cichorium intybus TaxID=13427 RepID=A0ACB9H311_CICIN|nr:hypothetical protein L2E82_02739 [Cichorium intybus]
MYGNPHSQRNSLPFMSPLNDRNESLSLSEAFPSLVLSLVFRQGKTYRQIKSLAKMSLKGFSDGLPTDSSVEKFWYTRNRLPKVAGKACLGDVIEFQRRKTIDARILISYGGAEEVLNDSILPWIHVRSGYVFHGFLEFYLCQIEQKEAVLDPIIFLNIQSQVGHSTTGFVNSADGFLNGKLKEITRSCMVVLVWLNGD